MNDDDDDDGTISLDLKVVNYCMNDAMILLEQGLHVSIFTYFSLLSNKSAKLICRSAHLN